MSTKIAKIENEADNAVTVADAYEGLSEVAMTPEMVAVLKQTQALEAEIEMLNYEFTKPTDLLNVPINVLDAIASEIRDDDELKDVVIFQVEECETGLHHFVMQSSNEIRNRYVQLFENRKFLALTFKKPVPPLTNYHFVEDMRYQKAGNTAIVLKRI